MKRILSYLIVLLLVSLSSSAVANKSGLKEMLQALERLPIKYGINNFTLGDAAVVIARAELPGEGAGGGDVYTVMRQQGGKWVLIQYPDHTFNTSAWSHAGEDAVSAAMFFSPPKTSGNNLKSLYLLKAERRPEKSVADSGVVIFDMYKVQENADFGFMEFQKTDRLMTEKKYTNVELALKTELTVSLHDHKPEMPEH